jgi:hypothetical protein
MVRQSFVVVSAFGLHCRLDFLHNWEVSVEAGDASISLVPLSETRSGSPRQLNLPGTYIDRLVHRFGTGVDCLARSGETASCGNTEDEASLEFLAAKRDILEAVEAVAEVSAASVDGRKCHAATAGPARKLKRLVPATMSPVFGFVGQ